MELKAAQSSQTNDLTRLSPASRPSLALPKTKFLRLNRGGTKHDQRSPSREGFGIPPVNG